MPSPTSPVEKPVRTALVVEDDASLRELLITMLETRGFRVLGAEDGEEALKILSRDFTAVNVVITDFVMPKMYGDELLREIKQRAPDFPSVLVTGEVPDSIILGLLDQRRTVVVIKPFEWKILLEAIERVLSDDVIASVSTRVAVRLPCRIDGGSQKGVKSATIRDISFTGALLGIERLGGANPDFQVSSDFKMRLQGFENFAIQARVRRLVPSSDGESIEAIGVSFEPDRSDSEANLFLKKLVLGKMKNMGVGIA
ncbi:MAG: response regulator [Oligoflexia bacterium]|nr:response regulator [Oligoflexia bacterium]